MSSALVVLSGGQDSTTCLFLARQKFKYIHAVTFDYGQRHQVEIDAAKAVAERAGVESHTILKVPSELLRSTSPLTSANELETYDDYASMDEVIGDRVELTFVPMRNAFFLTMAANLAVSLGVRDLVTGVCQQDNANYPDCRKSFVDAQAQAINEALGIGDFKIHTPLINLTKSQSIKLALSVEGCYEALAYSHTCYAGEVPPCGKCHACVLRAHGFAEAGVDDPLVVRTRSND